MNFIKILLALSAAFTLSQSAIAQDATIQSDRKTCDHSSILKVLKKNSTKKLLKFLKENSGYDLKCLDADGNTLLIKGGEFGYSGAYKSVPILLEAGVDPDVVNDFGQTAFLIYSQYDYKFLNDEKNPRILLAKAGANINAIDHFGFNAAHYSALSLKLDAFWEITRGGVDAKALTKDGSSVWDIAEYHGRVQGLQAAVNLGAANLKYYNFMNTLKTRGITSAKRFDGYVMTKSNGEPLKKKTVEQKKKPSGLAGFLDSAIVRSEGTGRKCNHVLVIGNFSGISLNGQIMTQLQNGRYQEYGDKSGGKLFLPAGGVAKHQIWLTQGGKQRLMLAASGQSARADYIDFDISNECPHGERSLSNRSFVVEKNNANGMLSIFEDKNGDGKRDLEVQKVKQDHTAQNQTSDNCSKIDLLATKLNSDSTAMLYQDEQLASLYSAVNCEMSPETLKQRQQISGLLSAR